jgi:hypothetical protein
MHDMDRLPTGQDGVSSCRLVTCAKASAGTRVGTSGKHLGHVHLTWAFAEATVLCLRTHPAGQQYRARLEKTHHTGKALTLWAPTLARAVYDRRKRPTAFARAQCLQREGSSVGAPAASLDTQGMRLARASGTSSIIASLHAKGRIGLVAQRPRLCWDSHAGFGTSGESRTQGRGLPLSRACPARASPPGAALPVQGRYEGTASLLGRRGDPNGSLHSLPRWCQSLKTGVVQHAALAPVHGHDVSTRDRLSTAPGPGQRKKMRTIRSQGSFVS